MIVQGMLCMYDRDYSPPVLASRPAGLRSSLLYCSKPCVKIKKAILILIPAIDKLVDSLKLKEEYSHEIEQNKKN